jgi:hypothetical protein
MTLLTEFKKLNLEKTNEQLETERFEKIKEILQKVCLKQDITDIEKIDLQNEVKLRDFNTRKLVVTKVVNKVRIVLLATYSDNSVTFQSLKNEITAKRLPIQILATKFGSFENWLKSNKFEIDTVTKISSFTDSFRKLVCEVAKIQNIETLNLNKQSAKFEVRKFASAIKIRDTKTALKNGVSYGSVSQHYLDSVKAIKEKELEKSKLLKKKGIKPKKVATKKESHVLSV